MAFQVFTSCAVSALRGTTSRTVAWGATLVSLASWILAQYAIPYLAQSKLFSPSLLLLFSFPSVFAAIALAGMLISRHFIIAFLVNVACLLWIVGSILLLALVIMAFSADSHRHAQRVVNANELIGRWEPTEESLNLLFFSEDYYRTGEPHSLSLRSDGTLSFASVIRSSENPKKRYDYLKSVGTWTLRQRDPNEKFSPNQLRLVLDGPRYQLRQSFYLMEQDGSLTLWHSIGDPFCGEYLEYRRPENGG